MRVGGDWYLVVPMQQPGQIAISVGDVVGHGLPAAIVMSRLRAAVAATALTGADPDAVLSALDRFAAAIPGALRDGQLCGDRNRPAGNGRRRQQHQLYLRRTSLPIAGDAGPTAALSAVRPTAPGCGVGRPSHEKHGTTGIAGGQPGLALHRRPDRAAGRDTRSRIRTAAGRGGISGGPAGRGFLRRVARPDGPARRLHR